MGAGAGKQKRIQKRNAESTIKAIQHPALDKSITEEQFDRKKKHSV